MAFRFPRMEERESRAWLGLIRVVELLPTALDAQLQRDANLNHFEFTVLSALRLVPESTMRMTALADETNASLSRLSHVCSRLEKRGLVERRVGEDDRRATDIHLTPKGRRELVRAMPGHVSAVRDLVIDALTPAQVDALAEIARAIGTRLPGGRDREPFTG